MCPSPSVASKTLTPSGILQSAKMVPLMQCPALETLQHIQTQRLVLGLDFAAAALMQQHSSGSSPTLTSGSSVLLVSWDSTATQPLALLTWSPLVKLLGAVEPFHRDQHS